MMPGARFKLCSGTSLAGPMSKLRKSLELCMPGRQMLGVHGIRVMASTQAGNP